MNKKQLIQGYAYKNCQKMFRTPQGILKHPFIVPGAGYENCLWDWDSWLTNIAIRQILLESGDNISFSEYERGCVLNFAEHTDELGRMPIYIIPEGDYPNFKACSETNIHKPCLAQHAAFIIKQSGDFEWIRTVYPSIKRSIDYYYNNCRHTSGLYFWIDDNAIGVDNDPCTFYRPKKSSASIFLNCFMHKELLALEFIAKKLGLATDAAYYAEKAEQLKVAVRQNCWDERDGFYYSVDINLLPIDKESALHSGCPRHWNTLIQRIGVWSGVLAMWAGIATKEQAERMVKEHICNKSTFCAPYGIRTLSKAEKMYMIKRSGNPSCWLGPVWGISNYLTFSALRKYEYFAEAKELAEKTIDLFGNDIAQNGVTSEYYDPEAATPISNPGFQNWNLLSVNMIAWLEGREYISEF